MPFEPSVGAAQRVEHLRFVHRQEEERLTKTRAAQLGLPYINLDVAPINSDELISLPEPEARAAQLVLIQKVGDKVFVALADPAKLEAQQIIADLKQRGLACNLLLASLSSLEKAWRFYKLYRPPQDTIEGIFMVHSATYEDLVAGVSNLKDLAGALEQHTKNTSEFLGRLFVGALHAGSTDIHIEPYELDIKVRYRLDGVLQDIVEIPAEHYHLLLSRVKVLAHLKLNLHNSNQDGRFSIRIDSPKLKHRDFDVRLSILPGGSGESMVMRMLGANIVKYELRALGMHEEQYKMLAKEISKPNGLILTTGPTGSGKTTALYAALESIKTPEIKIITIEDPIEYKIDGITQTQVDAREGYTFEQGLVAILRQDPDIILVGEIRTNDAANMAINAALTGHIVFSTLHTNDSAGAIPRLRNLMVERTLIPSALSAVIAQRLVRLLCPDCKEAYAPSADILVAIEQGLALISPKAKITPPENLKTLYRAKGCPKCFGTGYRGRTGIFEIFMMDDVMEKLVLADATSYEIRKAAMEQGMITLLQHGLLKMLAGETSLDEIQRVAGDARYIAELYGQAVVSLLSHSLTIPKEIVTALTPENLSPRSVAAKLAASSLDDLIAWAVASAFKLRASDIHFEPQKDTLTVRYRVDGVLMEMAEIPKKLFLPLVSQIKEYSGMKVGVAQEIQEGRFTTVIGQESFDLRVSLIPGGFGETIVLRLLRADIQATSLEELGVDSYFLPKIKAELKRSNGIIVVTGPTGAGKTTTLYAMMAGLNTAAVKIITIENPIEYKMKGVVQTQIDPDRGYTFTTALKSLLRQDPDIMMVGEIRDFDTAQTAIQAALTGHLILSTIHTNDALSTIQRMENLGVGRGDIAATLNSAIAQRLVRRLCPKCKVEAPLSAELAGRISTALKDLPPQVTPPQCTPGQIIYAAGPGCAQCLGGYKGRVAVFEIIIFDQNLKQLVAQGATLQDLAVAARQTGTLSLLQDALLKTLQGITSLEEVSQVLGF